MKHPIISIVVAIAQKNRAIGKDNKLPWHIPSDLKRFKTITTGHPIIMGRKTYESIGHALPNRTNIIVTRDINYSAEGCFVAHTLEEAIEKARSIDSKEICIIGGGEIFKQALPYTDKLYLTLVEGDIVGDVFFPPYDKFNTILNQSTHEENGYRFTYIDLIKGDGLS